MKFSIGDSLKKAWALFKERPGFFIGLNVIYFGIVLIGNSENANALRSIVSAVLSIIWSLVSASVMLAAVDGKTEKLGFGALKGHFLGFKRFAALFGWIILVYIVGFALAAGVGILFFASLFANISSLSGIAVVGIVLLFVVMLYFGVRFGFFMYAYVEGKGFITSLKYSWRLVGGMWWRMLGTSIVIGLIGIAGAIALGVGVFVTYSLAMLMFAMLYRALQAHKEGVPVVAQPIVTEAVEPVVVPDTIDIPEQV